jgi:hypothetical protein
MLVKGGVGRHEREEGSYQVGDQEKMKTLEGLMDAIIDANEGCDRISIGQAFGVVGQRSFGPVLLVPGLIALSPLSGIPGMPTLVGLMVLLVTSQLLMGRSDIWLPQFILRRSASRKRFDKAMGVMRKVARFVDKLIKPRLCFLTKGVAQYAIASVCLLLSLASPLLELLPFVITGVGAAVSAFGLALLAEDGLLALLALLFCIATGIGAGIAAMS